MSYARKGMFHGSISAFVCIHFTPKNIFEKTLALLAKENEFLIFFVITIPGVDGGGGCVMFPEDEGFLVWAERLFFSRAFVVKALVILRYRK